MTRPGRTSLSNRTRVSIDGEILATTALAALFTDGDTKAWLKGTQASFDPPEVGPSEATMPEWMAIEKGFA
jgi:hypothetical protein